MLLAFTAIVLAGAVVPLTLSTIGQDRNSFIQDTQAMAKEDASVAQVRLVSRKPAAARPVDFHLLFVYKQVEQAGDGLVIYLANGRLLDATSQVPAGQWRQLAAQVAGTHRSGHHRDDGLAGDRRRSRLQPGHARRARARHGDPDPVHRAAGP